MPEPTEVQLPVMLPPARSQWLGLAATAAVGAVAVAAAWLGVTPLAAATTVAGALLAYGWPVLADLPSPRGSTGVVAGAALLGSAAVALTRGEPLLRWLSLAVAVAFVGELAHQLGRRDGRPRMVESVTGVVAALVLVASLACVVALPRSPAGPAGVLVWAAPVVVGLVPSAAALPPRLALPIGVVAGLVAGALLGGLLLPGGSVVVAGAVTGALVAGVGLLVHRLLAALPAAAGQVTARLSLAVAPLAATGLVAYVALRLLAR